MTAAAGPTERRPDPVGADAVLRQSSAGRSLAHRHRRLSQAVVPNNVSHGEAVHRDVPGGTADLAERRDGFTIRASRTSTRRTSAAVAPRSFPPITAAARRRAVNNGNPVAFNATFTNQGATTTITDAHLGRAGRRHDHLHDERAHGLVDEPVRRHRRQHQRCAYNSAGATASARSDDDHVHRSRPVAADPDSGVGRRATAERSPTRRVRAQAQGRRQDLDGEQHARRLQQGEHARRRDITVVPSATSFVLRTRADPGPIITKGQIDTLANPGAFGRHADVNTLTTVTADVPSATAGNLDGARHHVSIDRAERRRDRHDRTRPTSRRPRTSSPSVTAATTCCTSRTRTRRPTASRRRSSAPAARPPARIRPAGHPTSVRRRRPSRRRRRPRRRQRRRPHRPTTTTSTSTTTTTRCRRRRRRHLDVDDDHNAAADNDDVDVNTHGAADDHDVDINDDHDRAADNYDDDTTSRRRRQPPTLDDHDHDSRRWRRNRDRLRVPARSAWRTFYDSNGVLAPLTDVTQLGVR